MIAFANAFSSTTRPREVFIKYAVGFINFKADTACAGGEGEGSCAVTGMKIGPTVGLGLHAFINDWAAINIELRDIIVRSVADGSWIGAKVIDDYVR